MSNLNLVSRPLSLRGDVKEAYLCSITENHNNVSKVTNKAKDHNSFYSQLQIDDLYFQLVPDGYVAVCTRDSLLSKLWLINFLLKLAELLHLYVCVCEYV